MKLNKIRISDFRSILYQEVNFSENCLGLIGLNESGKSNVLNAIRLLDPKFEVTNQDRSKISRKLPKIVCEFQLEENEITSINTHVTNLTSEYILKGADSIIFNPPSKIFSTVQIIESGDGIKKEYSTNFPSDVVTGSKLLKLTAEATEIPEDAEIKLADTTVKVSDVKVISAELVTGDLQSHFTVFDVTDLNQQIIEYCKEQFKELNYEVIFWAYDSKYLLPSEITYESLMTNANPYENSAPLYNIFVLTRSLNIVNADSLSRKISLWKADSSERRKDSAIITKVINNYIQKIWSDYDQELKIELEETKITIHINDPKSQEKNFYAMEARSQGFKTFISFILTIAAEAENGIITNFILLLDEPETHLHPSGVRYMREELMKLSSTQNYIVYSTHSIFMIDRQNLRRHIIVQKNNEITNLKEVRSNNFIQESVIYEAMGTQLDEFSISLKNIIVEGELDLLLLTFFIGLYNDQELQKLIKDSKIWDGGGTKNIKTFFEKKLLPHASNWVVILDNDKPGQELYTWLITKYHVMNNAKVFPHLYSTNSKFELEDILPKDFIQEAYQLAISKLNIEKAPIDLTNDNRVVSDIFNEFKVRKEFDLGQNQLFEIEFKDGLYNIVDSELKKLQNGHEKADLKKQFIEKFPDYHKSIASILFKKPPKK